MEPTTHTVLLEHQRTALFGAGLFAIFLLIPMALMVFQIINNETSPTSVIVIMFLMAALIYNLWITRRWAKETQLIISHKSVIYKSTGITIITSWSNIETISGRLGRETLILHKSSASYISPMMSLLRATTTTNRNIDRQIPLYVFGLSKKSDLLVRLAKEHAPELLD